LTFFQRDAIPDRHGFRFKFDPRVYDLGVRGTYFIMRGIRNRDRDPEFTIHFENMANEKLRVITDELIKNDPVLQGFRDLHTAVGRSNRTYVSSTENLLRNLLRHRKLPSVNLLVDIYNLVSIQSHLALGAHDLQMVSGDIRLPLTTGTERFVPLGATEHKPVGQGEYAYIDDNNEIICRMEVRQVEKTKISTASSEVFFIIQGNRNCTENQLNAAMEILQNYLTRFTGGEVELLYAGGRPSTP